jgi:Mlc titration factor MtfA (ptsG expression regulator)
LTAGVRRLFHRDRPGLPADWRAILAARSAQWRLLTPAEQDRLGELADDLLRTKRWEAARGFQLTDEVRTLIAGHAALLILGLDETAYDGVGTIVVRARAMEASGPMAGPAAGVLVEAPGAIDGEAHQGGGPVMLVWSSARREAANPSWGRDVVLHEMAHKLDMLDGTMDGTPPLPDDAARRRWVEVCTAEYLAVRDGVDGWLRSYAGTNPGEFFAVATEAFFTRPVAMAADKPKLYEVLADYYRQDPAERVRAVLRMVRDSVDGRPLGETSGTSETSETSETA